MKSKTSFFNKSIFLKNIKRYWPIWGITTILMNIAPISTWLSAKRNGSSSVENRFNVISSYHEAIAIGVPIIAFVLATIVGTCVWSYMYNSKSAGFMHSVPISRKGLFFTTYLSGLAIMTIPYAIAGVFMILAGIVIGAGVPFATLELVGAVVCEAVFFFSFASLIAQLTGNVFAMPVLYVTFNFLAVGFENLITAVASLFLLGINYEISSRFAFLSPVVYLMKKVQSVTDRSRQYMVGGPYSYTIFGTKMENYFLIFVYGGVGILLAFVSYLIYSKRKNENAGDIICVKPLKYIILAVYTVVGTVGLAIAFYYLLDFSTWHINLVPYLFCLVVAVTLAFFTGSMLLGKTIKVFYKKNVMGYLVSLGLFITFTVCLFFDVFGIEKIIPKPSEVSMIRFYVDGNTYEVTRAKNENEINALVSLNEEIVENKGRILKEIDGEYGDYGYLSFFDFEYYGEDFNCVTRSYPIIWDSKESFMYEEIMKAISNPEMIKLLFHFDDRYEVKSASIELRSDSYDSIYVEGAELDELYAAFSKDIYEGNYIPRSREDRWNEGSINIELQYEKDEYDYFGNKFCDWVYVYVKPEMTNTIEALSNINGMSKERIDGILNWVDPNPVEYVEEVDYLG